VTSKFSTGKIVNPGQIGSVSGITDYWLGDKN